MSDITAAQPGVQPSFIRVLAGLGLVLLLLLVVIVGLLGRQVAEKIVTAMLMPCGIIWYLLTSSLILAAASRQRKTAGAFFCAWLMYTLFGSGFLATLMCTTIEGPYMGIDPLLQKPFDVVIVLGGGGAQGANQRLQGNTSGDRMILAAQLYHAGIAPRLICTGKRITKMDGAGPDPSEVSLILLTRLGVPESAIERLGGHNTSEEMRTLGERFHGKDTRLGLVTSAWHLPRAIRLAKNNGLDPDPLPADFISGPAGSMTAAQFIMSCIPQADNFFHASRIGKEYLAQLVGR